MTIARTAVQVLLPLLLVSLSVHANAACGPAGLDRLSPSPLVVSTLDLVDTNCLGAPIAVQVAQSGDTGTERVASVPAPEPPIGLMLTVGLAAMYIVLRRREQRRRRPVSVQVKPAGERAPLVTRQIVED